MNTVIEIKDSLGAQGILPGTDIPQQEPCPSWEELEQLYFVNFPDMDPTPAMCELGHTLDSCEQAYIEADPSFPAKVAKFYVEWIGLMAVLHRKLGIGQQIMEKEILKIWHGKKL